MSYEKELEYLRKEFKKSSAEFHQAEVEGYETDAEVWQNDMVNIGHQIHIHEQAAKADEYEAKAKAFDAIMREWEDERLTKSHILETIQKYYNKYERGGSDA